MRITAPNGAVSTQVRVDETAPGILSVASNGEAVSPANPLRVGATFTVYVGGLGALGADGAPSAETLVWIADEALEPASAGLSSVLPGVYQLKVKLPALFEPGAYRLRVQAGAKLSRPVPVAIA